MYVCHFILSEKRYSPSNRLMALKIDSTVDQSTTNESFFSLFTIQVLGNKDNLPVICSLNTSTVDPL